MTSGPDFSRYIQQRAQSFTGRDWLFHDIDAWLAAGTKDRFFVLTGEPGAGKSAVASRLVQMSLGQGASIVGTPALKPGFLSAFYFCSSRHPSWIDPSTFVRYLALTLADRYPAVKRALLDAGEAHVSLTATISAVVVEQSTAIQIGTLDLSGVNPEDLFERLVRKPLQTLYDSGVDDPLTILVDALDEADVNSRSSIATLVTRATDLPESVRFIVTTRPDQGLMRDLRRQPMTELPLSTGRGLEHSHHDVKAYAVQKLAAEPELLGALVAKSQGNFLYAQHAIEVLVTADPATSRAVLDRLPSGLDSIYAEYLDRLFRNAGDDWATRHATVVGTLAVAYEGLTEGQLACLSGGAPSQVRHTLSKMRQVVETDESAAVSERRWEIYHRSFAEFLVAADRAQEYWCDPAEHHAHIVQAYLGKPDTSLVNRDWSGVDAYGVRHLARHLFALTASPDYLRLLYALVTPAWMRAHGRIDGVHDGFAHDVALAIRAASVATDGLPDLVRLALIYASLHSAREVPSAVVGVFARDGQIERAWALATAISDRDERVRAILLIAEALIEADATDAATEAARIAVRGVAHVWHADDRRALIHHLAPVVARLGLIDFVLELYAGDVSEVVAALAAGVVTPAQDTSDGHVDALLDRLLNEVRRLPSDTESRAATGVAWALALRGRRSDAISLVDTVLSHQPRATTVVELVLALAAAGDTQRSIALGDELLRGSSGIDIGIAGHVWVKIARASALAGALDRGVGMALDLLGRGLIDAVECICDDLFDAGQDERARDVAERALATARSLPDAVRFGETRLMSTNPTTGIHTDTPRMIARDDLLCRLAWYLARSGNPGTRAAISEIQDPRTRQIALSRGASGFATAREASSARDILAAIPNVSLRDRATVEVVAALSAVDCVDDAVDLAASIHGRGPRTVALGGAALALARRGETRRAIELAQKTATECELSTDAGLVADALSAAASSLLDPRLAQNALEFAGRVEHTGQRALTVSRAIEAMIRAGAQPDAALTRQFVDQIGQAVEAGELGVEAAVTLLCRIGHCQAAVSFARKTPAGDDAHVALVRALTEAGDVKTAEDIIADIQHPNGRVQALAILARSLVATNRIDHALEQARTLRALATRAPGQVAADEWLAARALSDIAADLAAARDFDTALAVFGWLSALPATDRIFQELATRQFDTLQPSLCHPVADSLRAIVSALVYADQSERARNVAHGVADVSHRLATLSAIVTAERTLDPARQRDPVKEMLGQAESAVRDAWTANSDQFQPRPPGSPVTAFEPWRWAVILAELATAAAPADRRGQDVPVGFDAAIRAARAQAYLAERSWALTDVALRLEEIGCPEYALAIAQEAVAVANALGESGTLPPSRWQLYDRVCQVLGMLNRIDEALQLVNTMASEEERCHTLSNVIERISRRRGEQSACAVLAAALGDLPFLSRERVLRTLAQVAPRLKDWARGGTLRQICADVIDVEHVWGSTTTHVLPG